ncbi:hypothetical protein LINPERPRIM_LOCUS45128 [Linum perenne]
MRFSLVNVWYMKIFLLLLTYGNMNFKQKGGSPVIMKK